MYWKLEINEMHGGGMNLGGKSREWIHPSGEGSGERAQGRENLHLKPEKLISDAVSEHWSHFVYPYKSGNLKRGR